LWIDLDGTIDPHAVLRRECAPLTSELPSQDEKRVVWGRLDDFIQPLQRHALREEGPELD
jgi:hypothetical protein